MTVIDTGPGTYPDTAPGRLTFELPPGLSATEPPEERGDGRDDVRLLLSDGRTGAVTHHHFRALPGILRPGDLVVANSSATIPAAIDLAGGGRAYAGTVVHLSMPLPDGEWVVELRTRTAGGATERRPGGRAGDVLPLAGGAAIELRGAYPGGPGPARLWRARIGVPAGAGEGAVLDHLARHGRPIRYSYVDRDRPLAAYQTVFARRPGSAEMPSAGRPFTDVTLAQLAAAGVGVATVELHTGVASLEADERPYPERFTVPAPTARAVRHARARGGRVVAVGTTVVRALESAVDDRGDVRAATGWTDLVVTPGRSLRAVDGLLTGFHEPAASHLLMLEAVAGRDLLSRTYAAALAGGYRWHEFGDVNLILRG